MLTNIYIKTLLKINIWKYIIKVKMTISDVISCFGINPGFQWQLAI